MMFTTERMCRILTLKSLQLFAHSILLNIKASTVKQLIENLEKITINIYSMINYVLFLKLEKEHWWLIFFNIRVEWIEIM